MKARPLFAAACIFLSIDAAGCGGKQAAPAQIETRPLEENKAFAIIEEMLAERGYTWDKGVAMNLSTKASFPCDYRMKNQSIAIEFLTEEDRRRIGPIPEPAAGSRLHVLAARMPIAAQPASLGELVFVFFVDDRKFIYHFNPTSEQRADVTFLEVDSRLRRDLADFLSWYENSTVKK